MERVSINRKAIMAIIATIYTLISIQWSFKYGRLAQDITWDDVVYFIDGLKRLNEWQSNGFVAFALGIIGNFPHSLYSSLAAMISFAVFGVEDWAPYAINGIIIAALVAVICHITRGVETGVQILFVIYVLSFRFSLIAVHDFRPDVACAMASGVGVYLAGEAFSQRYPFSSKRTLVSIGGALAASFLIKPTLFSVSFTLLFLTCVTIALSGHLAGEGPSTEALPVQPMHKVFLVLLLPLLVVGPYLVVSGKGLISYFFSNALGEFAALWRLPGGFWESFKWYALGFGMLQPLGYGCVSLAAFGVSGFLVALLRRDMRLLRMAAFMVVCIMAVLSILTIGRYANPFFGMNYIVIVVFMIVKLTYESYKNEKRKAFKYLFILMIISAIIVNVVSLRSENLFDSCRSELSRRGKSLNKLIVNDISYYLRSINEKSPSSVDIFVAFTGAVSSASMNWISMRDGDAHDVLHFLDRHYKPDLKSYIEMSRNAMFVIVAMKDTPDLWLGIPATGDINEALASELSNSGGFTLLKRYAAGRGGFLLFRNLRFPERLTERGSFSGFLPLEGPYPEMGLPRVRWGLWPESTVSFETDTAGVYPLVVGASGSGGQEMEILVNGSVIGRILFEEGGTVRTFRADCELGKGSQKLCFRYGKLPVASSDGFLRAVLFRHLTFDRNL